LAGNHEFITGIKESVKFIDDSGFVLLRNEATTVSNMINLVGIDDDVFKYFKKNQETSENHILSGINNNKFTILLKHRPVVLKENIGFFDLQLSGHTHAGQIFPFSLLVRLVFPYIAGYYEINKNIALYVSRGSGTWGPPFKFLAPPEVTVIELINVKNN
jgi:predicted MPP superfamily phosphohydrolase